LDADVGRVLADIEATDWTGNAFDEDRLLLIAETKKQSGGVPITVTVQASDDTDAHPSVKLVSITCDDACDPALDIVGADYGTDDRQFEVRSERKGTSSSGRTYTMTYSAEDASGNKSTVTTTVTVPHDQGKK